MSFPPNQASPPTISPGGMAMSFKMLIMVTLLPLPDSPTMPMISPESTWKVASSTAFTRPSPMWNTVWRCRTSKRCSAIRSPPYRLPRIRGSRASRRPSPKMLKASTSRITAVPGASANTGHFSR